MSNKIEMNPFFNINFIERSKKYHCSGSKINFFGSFRFRLRPKSVLYFLLRIIVKSLNYCNILYHSEILKLPEMKKFSFAEPVWLITYLLKAAH